MHTPEMLKLCRVTKAKVFFLVLVYVFSTDLFEFSVTILEKGPFFKPPREKKDGLIKQLVQEIGSKIYSGYFWFKLSGVSKNEGLGIASKIISFFQKCGEELVRNRATSFERTTYKMQLPLHFKASFPNFILLLHCRDKQGNDTVMKWF